MAEERARVSYEGPDPEAHNTARMYVPLAKSVVKPIYGTQRGGSARPRCCKEGLPLCSPNGTLCPGPAYLRFGGTLGHGGDLPSGHLVHHSWIQIE